MEKLTRVKRQSLRTQVYTQLKEKILNEQWEVGEKLPSEAELCESFGVSRVTVRAALQQLEILGLVETRHGEGTYVCEYSALKTLNTLHPLPPINRHKDLISVLEYRQIVEKGTIKLALRNMTDEDIEQLEHTYQLMLQTVNNPKRHAEADHLFHFLLAKISQNSLLCTVSSTIATILANSMVDIVKLLGSDLGLKYHRKLIDAIKERDSLKCETLMEEHIQMTIDAVIKVRTKDQ
ncbi:MAG: FadR family transcriptional regulator [Lentisphaerae bacterium]|nr:FadR family transcriptional regulator [Lentisphaerota bacterium]